MEGVERNKVKLVSHNDEWEAEFNDVKPVLVRIFGVEGEDIQHVGSTSIKAIVTKPILDIAIEVESFSSLNVDGMIGLGYDYRGEAGVPGRRLFVLRSIEGDSLHHVHCFERRGDGFRKQLFFRDYLTNRPDVAKQYSILKIDLTLKYPNDRIQYTEGKDRFIQSILDQMGK